jgi:hypothetical protein
MVVSIVLAVVTLLKLGQIWILTNDGCAMGWFRKKHPLPTKTNMAMLSTLFF